MENIEQLKEKRSRFIRSAKGILDRALRETRPLRPAEEADLDGLEAKIAATDRTLGRYTRFTGDDTPAPGTFLRCVTALAKFRGNRDAAVAYAEENSPPDVARALSASVATAGGFAIPEGYGSEFIEALRPLVAVRKLNPVVLPMPAGNFRWPRISAGGASAGYSTEGAVISPSQPVFGAVEFLARKMVGLVPISNTLLRSAQPAADMMIREDLMATVASVEDAAFIRGDGTQGVPKGLRYWAVPSNVLNSSGSDIASIDSDLQAMELALINNNVRMIRPGWILSGRTETYLRTLRNATSGVRAYPEMERGMLRGKPYAATTNVPVNLGGGNATEIYLADFADVVIAEAMFVIDASSQGVYTNAGGSKVSAFQQDQTLVRVISQHDLGMRHESVAVLQGVAY